MAYPDTQLFINGQWQESTSGNHLPVFNPSTGLQIGRVSHAAEADLERAALAARDGFAVWRDTPALERARIMRRAAALMRERASDIAPLLTQEHGKPVGEALLETMSAADVIEWFADEGMRVYGRIIPARNLSVRQLVLKEPVGPVVAFSPWNFPIGQAVRKVSAALATGCSIIVKAPEETPASPAALIRAFADAGVPDGVIGLVYGNPAEISKYLIAHPIIRKITFTGSTVVGKQLAALAGQHMKRATMELGGHAPVIIAEDADVALAVQSAGAGKFRNAGQICMAPTRFLVHEAIATEFEAALTRHAQGLKVADGFVEGVNMGPLANPRRITSMSELTQDAVARGARLTAGGAQIGSNGNFWSPTVLLDVPRDARVFNDEPFGPVAAVRRVQSLEEAIDEANRLPYALAAYAFTRSIKNVHLLTQRVESGMLWINQSAAPWPEIPLGGMKDSGYGSEGGPEALDAYLNTRSVVTTAL